MTQAPEKPIYRVLSAMLCEGYRQHPDGYLDLIRVGFNQLVPSEFPAAGRLGVAVTIARADERRFTPGEAATINVELVDPAVMLLRSGRTASSRKPSSAVPAAPSPRF